jgi:alanyl-tRNA synthetase
VGPYKVASFIVVNVDCIHTFSLTRARSFGDYFKEDAIKYAWDLLTQVYGLDPDRIYATYFRGNDQVEADLEAKELWLQYLPPERVIG